METMSFARGHFNRVWPIVRAPYRLIRASGWTAIDLALGVKTTLLADQLWVGSQRSPDFEHGSVGWLKAWRILKRASLRPTDILYDVGSGTGRMVLTASQFRIKRVIGLDNTERMVKAAKNNLETFRLKAKCDVVIKLGDAIADEFPDEVTVVYFYNSFRGNTFENFIVRIFESIDRNPRSIKFIYHNPFEHDRLMTTGRIELINRTYGLRPTKTWSRTLSTYYYKIS